MAYHGKNRTAKSLTFNALGERGFSIVSPGNSVAVTTVQDSIVLTQQCRILRVGFIYSALAGAPAVQLVVGAGAPVAVGSKDVIATAGTMLFAAAQTLTAAPQAGQLFNPAQMNAVYSAGTVLTLRALTGGGDSVTNLKTNLLLVYEDAYPTKPVLGENLNPSDF